MNKKLIKVNEKLKKKLQEKTKQLKEANARLAKSLKLRSQFISDASHELRTPLAIAKLNLELFRGQLHANSSSSLEILEAIDNEINRAANILSDIVFFTSIDNDSVKAMEVAKIDVKRFVEHIAGRIQSFAGKKNIGVVYKKDKWNPIINGDKIKLEKLFLNIIANSLKYGKINGWVKIYIEPDVKNKAVRVIISDNGVGISKKDLPRIFDRFYRTKLSRNDGEGGFGLGLPVCKWIVDQHKGNITAESRLGKGSVFTITLPINANI